MKCETCGGRGTFDDEDIAQACIEAGDASICYDCDGSGEVEICPVCEGTKRINEQWFKGFLVYDDPCPECDERGVV